VGARKKKKSFTASSGEFLRTSLGGGGSLVSRKLKNFVADFVKFSFFGFQEGFCSITNPRLLLLEYPTACPVLLVFFFLSFSLLEEWLLRLFLLCDFFCFFLDCFVC
jgi:hypothetical protein